MQMTLLAYFSNHFFFLSVIFDTIIILILKVLSLKNKFYSVWHSGTIISLDRKRSQDLARVAEKSFTTKISSMKKKKKNFK